MLSFCRILYADLEFHPEERFSMAARLLLQGMIKRDPSTRMGAWENPPQDIMSAPFFHGIQWDAIYERRFDGPYVPEVQVFGSKSKKADSGGNGGEGGEGSGNGSSGKAGGQDGSGNKKAGNGAGSDDSDSGEDSESELKGMRDSVFIQPRDGAGNNLLDWSFIDEKVLAETYAESGDGDKDSKEARRARRRKKRAAEAAAAQELKISEEIGNNVVGFASPARSATASAAGAAPAEIAEGAGAAPPAPAESGPVEAAAEGDVADLAPAVTSEHL